MDDEILKFILARLEKIDEKHDSSIERVLAELSRQSTNLEIYNGHLSEHMRRTDILEKCQKDLESRVEPLETEFNRKKVIKDFLASRYGLVLKLVTLVGAVLGAFVAFDKIWPNVL